MSSMSEERRGVLLILASALAFSVMSVLVKRAGQTLPVSMLVLARSVVTLLISFAVLRWSGVSVWGSDRPRLVLRGVLGLGGLVCFFTAVTHLPLAAATTIHYLNPLITAFGAAHFLGERVDRRLGVAMLLGFSGVLLVSRPAALFGAAESLDAVGVAAALGGAVFSGLAYVLVRRLARREHPDVIVFYFPLIAVPVLAPWAYAEWRDPTFEEWLILGALGVATQAGQVLLTRGIARVPAGRAMTIGYVQIAFAALWGVTLYGEPITAFTAGGAALVAGAAWALR